MADDYLEWQTREKHDVAETVTNSSASHASAEQLVRGLLERINRVVDTNQDHIQTANNAHRTTQFDELMVGQETTTFSLASQWGDLKLRETVETSGSGDVSANNQGEVELTTGTTASSTASMTSKQAGSYEPGTTAIEGAATRLLQPSGSLVEDEEILWGFYDDENGVGWGVDSTDFFIFFRRTGSTDKVYRDNFSVDPLDGTGPSGYETNLQTTNIFQTEFTWYGAGEIAYLFPKNQGQYDNAQPNRLLAHVKDPREDSFNGPSLAQPDLPFRFEVSNSGSTNDIGLTVTGRSFRRVDQVGVQTRRRPVDSVEDYSNLTQGSYKPVFAFTKKDTYNGFPNQINVRFDETTFITNEDASMRVELGENLLSSSTTFSDPDSWGSSSAVQVAKGDNIVTQSANMPGFIIAEEIERGATTTATSNEQAKGDKVEIDKPIGRTDDLIVLVRQDTGNSTTISSTTRWEENH